MLTRLRMAGGDSSPLTPRLRRTLEVVYAVQGVTEARVWQWPGRLAVGVRGSPASAPDELLRRVERAVSALREPGEQWDFGILDAIRDVAPHDDSGKRA